ncbi:MAG: virginiamycin B lyase family protein, partial [bacterium]
MFRSFVVWPKRLVALLIGVMLLVSGCSQTASGQTQQTVQAGAPTATTNPNCTPDYCTPADWNAQSAPDTLDPAKVAALPSNLTNYVEPLNVIISARSTVPLAAILAATTDWQVVPTGTGVVSTQCLSPVSAERANVTTGGPVTQQQSWRLGGCLQGNPLSLSGDENHARIWNQTVPSSTSNAWFIAASYETACFYINGTPPRLESYAEASKTDIAKGTSWHCIDGGLGSSTKVETGCAGGYDCGGKDLADAIVAGAQMQQGWSATSQTITRPLGTTSMGEDGVPFSPTVYVVTVTQTGSSPTPATSPITEFNISTQFGIASMLSGSITPGSDGALWFTDEGADAIGRISVTGEVKEFATPTRTSGPGATTLDIETNGITSGPDGNLWFTENNNGAGQIGRCTPKGAITEFPVHGGEPTSITKGPDGNLWFTDNSFNNAIGVITPSGVVKEYTIPTAYSGPSSIVSGPDRNLWFIEAGKIGRVTTGGAFTTFPMPKNTGGPTELTVGPD